MTVTDFNPWSAIIGGILIGTSSAWAIALNGKVPGISGLCARVLCAERGDTAWRVFFLIGLILAAGLVFQLMPDAAAFGMASSLPIVILAGLFVGIGTRVGGGCTSGHGICGVGRGSPRSLVGTLTFTGAGILTVYLMSHVIGGAA